LSVLVVTGISGSLGKAILAEQELLKQNGITRIRGLSRDEQKQVALQKSYKGEIPLDCYLADVSDRKRMLFGLRGAHYVIHAAAQKHIDKFETDVPTGYKNNIRGTQNVAEGFLNSKNAIAGIFVSTDKAALATTSYGVSKLASEHLWTWHNSFQQGIDFKIGRWGNIFGSRGSVIETWTDLAKEKKPLPITDMRCTRFFMLIEDAAKFCLNTLFNSPRGVSIPAMKSTDMPSMAEIIWQHFNPEIPFKPTAVGMRGIEKVHEILRPEGPSSDEVERFTKAELKSMYSMWLDKRKD
jgi:UDP-N-acetylglucosamine 4,6-dehydratase